MIPIWGPFEHEAATYDNDAAGMHMAQVITMKPVWEFIFFCSIAEEMLPICWCLLFGPPIRFYYVFGMELN